MPETFLAGDSRAEALKAEIAGWLIAIAPRGWRRIVCDYEWRESASRYAGSEITVAVARKFFGDVDCTCLNLARDGRIITGSCQLARLAMEAQGKRACTLSAVIKRNLPHEWYVDFASPARFTAEDEELGSSLRNPALRRPFVKFAAGDEWLSRIPASYIPSHQF